MSELLPDRETVGRAIEIYLEHAYPGPPPPTVAALLAKLRQTPDDELWLGSLFADRATSEPRTRWSLRLGNDRYPFMKLVIDRSPDGSKMLFKADTHDQHMAPPPESEEFETFRELMVFNEARAKAIESAWTASGFSTFTTWLKADLRKRRGNSDASWPS